MARAVNRLTVRGAQTLGPGFHADGDGLYLRVDSGGARRWTFVFQWAGKRAEMGLGGFPGVGLAEAREARNEARRAIRAGLNPISERQRQKRAESPTTFGAFATELVAELAVGWRNEKHREQWSSTLKTYCKPIWDRPIDQVSTDDVRSILKPIWITKAETASRLRGRIEKVLDAAKARGLRSGENPAVWRGNLKHLLPARQKLQRGHHPALDYKKAPQFVQALRTKTSPSARALEFTILTAARENEVLGARWAEFDLEEKVWTVPTSRMKAGKEHRVPLSEAALKVLGLKGEDHDLAFPGNKQGKPLSNMTMDMLVRRMDVGKATVHGFRSTFRDWAGEETEFAREVIETALAHSIGNAVERAYRRGDALQKRREVMDAWAEYLAQKKEPPSETEAQGGSETSDSEAA